MKTKTIVALLFVVVLSITAGMALAQDVPLGRLQPLLVDIQQQIPVDVTFVIDGSEPQTVTVPMALDLNLQISLSSTMTPVITLAATNPAIVTVSQMQAEGSPLTDNSDLPFAIEVVDGVEILQLRSGPDYWDGFELIGEIRNTTEKTLTSLSLIVTTYDADGAIMDVTFGGMQMDQVAAGKTSPIQASVQTPFVDVASYLVQMTARFE